VHKDHIMCNTLQQAESVQINTERNMKHKLSDSITFFCMLRS